MTFKIGDKVSAIDTVKRYHVLQMKKGASGEVIGFNYEGHAEVQLKSSVAVVPQDMLKPYQKQTKVTLESLSNVDLLEKYDELVRDERSAPSTRTAKYAKLLKDLEKCKTELLKRLGN